MLVLVGCITVSGVPRAQPALADVSSASYDGGDTTVLDPFNPQSLADFYRQLPAATDEVGTTVTSPTVSFSSASTIAGDTGVDVVEMPRSVGPWTRQGC